MVSRESVEEVFLPDNEDCLEYLRKQRWPEEVTCPHCAPGGVDGRRSWAAVISGLIVPEPVVGFRFAVEDAGFGGSKRCSYRGK